MMTTTPPIRPAAAAVDAQLASRPPARYAVTKPEAERPGWIPKGLFDSTVATMQKAIVDANARGVQRGYQLGKNTGTRQGWLAGCLAGFVVGAGMVGIVWWALQ